MYYIAVIIWALILSVVIVYGLGWPWTQEQRERSIRTQARDNYCRQKAEAARAAIYNDELQKLKAEEADGRNPC